jgi:hypothetical protein
METKGKPFQGECQKHTGIGSSSSIYRVLGLLEFSVAWQPTSKYGDCLTATGKTLKQNAWAVSSHSSLQNPRR